MTNDQGFRDDSSVAQEKVNIKFQGELGRWQQQGILLLNNLEQEGAGYIEGEDAYLDDKLIKNNNNPEAYRDAKSWRVISEWTLGDSRLGQFRIRPYLRWNEMQFLMHFVPWQPLEENGHQSLGAQFLWQKKVYGLDWSAGVEGDFSQAYLIETQESEAPFTPAALPQGEHYNFDVDITQSALFAGMALQLAPQLRADLRLRREMLRYDYSNHLEDGYACAPAVGNCRFYRPTSREDVFVSPSWRVGLNYSLGENQALFWNAGRAFRAPQAIEMYRLQTEQELDAFKEVLGLGSEIGWRYLGDTLSAQMALYTLEQSDAIYQDTQRRYLSGADSTHRGLEYEMSWQFLSAWKLVASGQYAENRYDNAPLTLGQSQNIVDKDIDTAPRRKMYAAIEWEINSDHSLNLGWQKMGAYYLDPENAYSYPGHELLNAGWKWRFFSNWETLLTVKNLANKKYAERADSAFGDYRYFPGARRSIILKVSRRL